MSSKSGFLRTALVALAVSPVLLGCGGGGAPSTDDNLKAAQKEMEKVRGSEMGEKMQEKMGMKPGTPGDPAMEEMKKKMMSGGAPGQQP